MKKLLFGIISCILFFSISNTSFASSEQGYIEQLLDINYGIEEYDLELVDLHERDFYSQDFQYAYKEFVGINEKLKDLIMKQYRNGQLKYYQVNGSINYQKKFVYFTDKLFEYLEIKEEHPNYLDIDHAILNTYRQVRVNYKRLEWLLGY